MVVGNAAISVGATAMIALGVFLAMREEGQLAVRVLGAYFVARGLVNAGNGYTGLLAQVGPGGPLLSIAQRDGLRRFIGVPLTLIPPLVLLFASLYPRRRGPLGTNPAMRRGLYAVTALFCLFGVFQAVPPSLDPEYGPVLGWLFSRPVAVLISSLFLASYMLAGLVFVRDYLHEAAVPDRDGLLLVAVGFLFDGIYLGTLNLLRALTRATPVGSVQVWKIAGLLALPVVLGLLAFHAIRTDDRGERRKMGWTFAGLLTPVGLALLVSPLLGLTSTRASAQLTVNGLSIIVFPLLIVYGVLRHDLLALDIDLSRGVKYGAAAAVLLVVYAAVNLVATVQFGGLGGQLLAVLATGLLVLAATPLSRVWQPEGGRLLGLGSETYLDREAVDVYRGTLEEALAAGDGDLGESDERMLARMRERLGISDREHAVLLHALEPRLEADDDALLAEGRTVAGRYEVDDELATGGHGATYKAHDTQLDRDVVLKQLHGSGGGSLDLDEEARRLGAVQHPTTVTVHDVIRLGDEVVVVMEYLQRGSLSDRLEEGALDREGFEKIATDALTALEVVHDEGLVHRDVKPGNLLLTDDGGAKLTDFGIARVTGEETTMGFGATEPVGTLRYMSPEQAKGQPVDERSDLFSLAATLYEAYTGEPYIPVEPGESLVEVQMRVAGLGPFDEDIEAAEPLSNWFAKALAPRPEDRFASAREMREALTDALAGRRASG